MNSDKKPEEIFFKIRFNTTHGDTDLYWRIIINDEEFLARSLKCTVPTYSESSFDHRAGAVKFHIAGICSEFYLDESNNALIK